MKALVIEMAKTNGNLSLFRTAYLWRFGKDLSRESLYDDIEQFLRDGTVPPYLCAYVVSRYSDDHSVEHVLATSPADASTA